MVVDAFSRMPGTGKDLGFIGGLGYKDFNFVNLQLTDDKLFFSCS